MELQYAFCAKYADVAADGLLTAFGAGMDSFRVAQFPAIIPAIAVAGTVTVRPEELGEHRMQIEIFGPTGDRNPLEIDFPLNMKQPPEAPPRDPRMTFALSIQNLVIGMEGWQEFRILIDRQQLGAVRFHVSRQVDEQRGQA